ncbi:MAG: hypothetical protein KAW88_05225 [Candidatus Cloacimonetes bacterium]|nr:hypothetical protein [Candidatus Cloacimonadota bacterium]
MGLIGYFNKRVKLFTIWDIKLCQLTAMMVMIILIKFIPQIISLNIWWYVILLILAAIRPMHVMFFKK